MKRALAALVVLGVAHFSFQFDPAMGEVKTKPIITTTKPSGVKTSPLSKDECRKFGGLVEVATICKSGSMCTTIDENGKSHRLCISAAK